MLVKTNSKQHLGLLRFRKLQVKFLTFYSKLHWQLAAPEGLSRDSGKHEWTTQSTIIHPP